MKVWVTKYALTKGIYESREGKIIDGGKYFTEDHRGMDSLFLTLEGYSITELEAKEMANIMRLKKIESLKKSIIKLEKLKF